MFFPFVKRILVIEITNRFCFCFDSIKVKNKFKLKRTCLSSLLFLKFVGRYPILWLDTWKNKLSGKIHWSALYEGFVVCLFKMLSPPPFFSLLFRLCTLCCLAILPSTRLSVVIFIYHQVLYNNNKMLVPFMYCLYEYLKCLLTKCTLHVNQDYSDNLMYFL